MSQPKPTRTAADDHLLIRSITPDGDAPIEVSGVTVLVGPNNAGKSATLRDLVRLAGNFSLERHEALPAEEPATTVLRDVTFVGKLTLDRLTRGLVSYTEDSVEGTTIQGIGPDLQTPYRCTLGAEIKSVLYRPVITARSVRMTQLGQVMPLRVAYLPFHRCEEVLRPSVASSPAQAPENLLQAFRYADRGIAAELDAAFSAAFPGQHVLLDATEQVNLSLRIAAEIPEVGDDPVAAVRRFGQLRRADEGGAGQQGWLAVALTLLLCQGRVVLLDQPETGLHPQQAELLGQWLASHAPRLGCQVFLATHSPALLRGILQTAADATILRLSRNRDATSFQTVPADVASALGRFPMLAAQHALDGLFSDGVVLVPSAEDRVVYGAVAERAAGAGNVRFVQAYGDRNLAALTRIFRKAALPTCVVADLECLQSETGFSELVKAVTGNPAPPPWLATRERLAKHVEGMQDIDQLAATAQEVESFLDQLKKGNVVEPAIRPGGSPRGDGRERWARLHREQLSNVPTELRVWVEELLDDLKHHGIFVSPKAGFSGWMSPETPITDRELAFAKAVQALHRGECPADLRAFVTEIVTYLRLLVAPTRPARIKADKP